MKDYRRGHGFEVLTVVTYEAIYLICFLWLSLVIYIYSSHTHTLSVSGSMNVHQLRWWCHLEAKTDDVLWIELIFFFCFFLGDLILIDDSWLSLILFSFSCIHRALLICLSIYLGNGSLNDANQMLLNTSCNQPTITSIVSTHCSLTSANQGHDNDNEQAQEQVNEDNIDDDNRQEVQGENEREKDASLSPNHIDVESNTVASSTLLRTKKLKHRHSSSIVLPSRLPRSSSSLVRVKPMAAMIRHRHQSSHPHHDAYRTLQLPVNSSNKLLMVTPSGHHRPSLPTTAGSENNLQTTGFRIHSGNYQQQKNSVNNCFDEETVRTLSRGKFICFNLG